MKVAAAIILVVIAVVANAQEEGAGKPNKKTDYLRALQEVEATSVLSLSLLFPAGIEGPIVNVADVSVQNSKTGKSAPPTYDNECAGAALVFDSNPCVDFAVPQAGANVTRGYIGKLDDNGILPNTKRFWESAMCPVNVHW